MKYGEADPSIPTLWDNRKDDHILLKALERRRSQLEKDLEKAGDDKRASIEDEMKEVDRQIEAMGHLMNFLD